MITLVIAPFLAFHKLRVERDKALAGGASPSDDEVRGLVHELESRDMSRTTYKRVPRKDINQAWLFSLAAPRLATGIAIQHWRYLDLQLGTVHWKNLISQWSIDGLITVMPQLDPPEWILEKRGKAVARAFQQEPPPEPPEVTTEGK